MPILAVESATEMAGVALADESGVLATETTSSRRRHAESLTPMVELVCRRAGFPVGAIEGICVDVGPGLFTGLRVGIATAKALGFALGVPVASATSLEVIASALCIAGFSTGEPSGSLFVPVVDARRGEVFSARYRSSGRERAALGQGVGAVVRQGDGAILQDPYAGIAREADDLLSTPEDLAASLTLVGERFVLAGDGAVRYADMLSRIPRARLVSSAAVPPVDVLAAIGVARLGAGLGVDAAQVLPRYLREADTQIHWAQRLPPREHSRTVI